MKGKQQGKIPQCSLMQKTLMEQLNPKDPLILLAKRIPWNVLEKEYAGFYAETGRPSKPIRLMLGLLLLKHVENLSDGRLMESWVRNPYYQAFCGFHEFQWRFPCDPSDISYFRKRIGEKGCTELFKMSVELHGEKALDPEVVLDTTVQEKAITFPTDARLHFKIIGKCLNIARTEGIQLRRTFRRELRKNARTIRFFRNSKHVQAQRKARKRVQTIAGVLVRELTRKLNPSDLPKYADALSLFSRVQSQKKNTKNKIYSLHEPQVACIAKGKENRKYEFGSKVSIAMTRTHNIIVGAANFQGNPYDGDTVAKTIASIREVTGKAPERIIADRGYRGRSDVDGTRISIPDTPSKAATACQKQKKRRDFGRRCAIEPVISHMKFNFRMGRNYLKGVLGDVVNLLLAVTAFNLRKWMLACPRPFFGLYALFKAFSPDRDAFSVACNMT